MQQQEWFERDKKRRREEEGEKREGGRGTEGSVGKMDGQNFCYRIFHVHCFHSVIN